MVTPRLNLSKISEPGQAYQGSVSQAGSQFRSLQNVAEGVAQAGSAIGGVVQRRREEEARDTYKKVSTRDRIESSSETARLKEQYQDDPKGYTEALNKIQSKRREKMLKNVDNPLAKQKLQEEFEFSSMEDNLKAVEYERTQFTKVSKSNIAESALVKSQADYQSPPSAREFLLDLDMDILDIDERDFSAEEKSALRESVIDSRINGTISGYMRGGSIADFRRAKELVNEMGDRLSPAQATKLNTKIDSERLRVQNVKAATERQERAALEKQFKAEQQGLREVFRTVTTDPDADVTDQLKLAGMTGKINVKNPIVLSRAKMNGEQLGISQDLKYTMLEQLSSSEDPFIIREKLHKAILTGELSAEDGEEVLDSMQVRTDSAFKRQEYKYADNLLKNSVTRGFSFNKTVEREKLNEMIRQRDDLIRETGIDPASASKIIMKENGKMSLPGMPKVRGVKGNQDTVEGIIEAKKQIIIKYKNGQIAPKEGENAIQILDRRMEALEEVPSIDDIMKRKGK